MSGQNLARGQEKFIVPLAGYTQAESCDDLQYQTGQNVNGQKRAADTVVYGTYAVSTGNAIAVGSTQRKIIKAAHGARKNDVVQFTSGSGVGVAIQILSCPDANTIILAATPEFSLSVGDTFDIKRYVSPEYTSTGALSVSATTGPIQFKKDAVDTYVSKDTVAPANTVGLPVEEVQKQLSDKIFHDYVVENVTTGAYVEVIASTAYLSKGMTWFDSCGYAMIVAFGAVASEVDQFYVPPGGFNGMIDFPIPAGTRVSIKVLETGKTANAGVLVANLVK